MELGESALQVMIMILICEIIKGSFPYTDPEKEVLVSPDASYFVNPCRLGNHVRRDEGLLIFIHSHLVQFHG